MKHTVEIDIPITPRQLAEEFCDMLSDDQEAFFVQVGEIAKGWPGAGWCQQSCAILNMASPDARDVVRTLASHLPKEDVDWIVAASGEN